MPVNIERNDFLGQNGNKLARISLAPKTSIKMQVFRKPIQKRPIFNGSRPKIAPDQLFMRVLASKTAFTRRFSVINWLTVRPTANRLVDAGDGVVERKKDFVAMVKQ